ncbi:hypothetical protein GA0115240_15513 [Streptomyces sp. DvalAA-14]|uniref:pyridoxamine 5'-phosphate oxidase family protein n=1 Tax=unclassified Streptomyces TaxID=2593676 RepID=UPI00081B8525|nr:MULTISPECIES: pyridoxamine 5'-phosphate oxidase family protein [unclassified Streptomyces]MYS23694.1 pyridoxamine 5'-phosphate oxidase [Streptomyces sp. SID4948]SCE37358.1 hypothetical protein GA0115240_15513 [Streptomyces sp. DvalAA-14]
MTESRLPVDAGFHAGELAVQERAGVRGDAARLSRMLEPAALSRGVAGFLEDRTFLVMAGRDSEGRLWTSPLTGPPGFVEVASATGLTVDALFPGADPLSGLTVGQKIGMIFIEFATSRRVRVNGILTSTAEGLLGVEVEQAYGNCPQYIQRRLLSPDTATRGARTAIRHDTLSAEDTQLIRSADTFFLGTTNPQRGTDASHRGGSTGFVRVEDNQLWWPDYQGNNMFNSFGNLAVDPEAALLFFDFRDGRTVQLSGTAEVRWGAPGSPGDDGGTGRRVVFTVQHVVSGNLLPAHETALRPYPHNSGPHRMTRA